MSFLENYLAYSESKLSGSRSSLEPSITSFTNKYIRTFDYQSHINGLLLGHVQSGKTSQMLGIISAAADLDIKFFLLLTTDNIRLQQQTFSRASEYLCDFLVCNELDDVLFINNNFQKPTLIILKKNSRVLDHWVKNIFSQSICKYHPLMVLDDEGDAASLNTKVNQNDISKINKNILSIINNSPSSIFLQVTATPYANLLLSTLSGIKPSFVHTFRPGNGYLGGDNFFNDQNKCAVFIDEDEQEILLKQDDIPIGLRQSIINFLLVCIDFKYLKDEETCNFLIHSSIKTNDHSIVEIKVLHFLSVLKEDAEKKSYSLEYLIKDIHSKLGCFEENVQFYIQKLSEIIDIVNVNLINSNNAFFDYDKGFNIVIGGNSLGRGVTFPKLNLTYYSRTSKTPQADTVWQHSRLFGYDRDPKYTKIYLTESLYHMFSELTDTNAVLFDTLEKEGINNIGLLFPKNLRPTRKNVINQSLFSSFTGGVNYFIETPEIQNRIELDNLLGKQDSEFECSPDILIKILKYIDDNEAERFVSCINSLIEKDKTMICTVYTRIDRDIAKETGVLLSPNDRNLSKLNQEKIILFMYRLVGSTAKGWSGTPLWIPNIRFPFGSLFFFTDDND